GRASLWTKDARISVAPTWRRAISDIFAIRAPRTFLRHGNVPPPRLTGSPPLRFRFAGRGRRMAEVYIAAAPEDGAKAQGLAEALARLGFAAEGGAPAESEFAAIAENAKCVVTLWSRTGAGAPWLAALAALALSKNTLV